MGAAVLLGVAGYSYFSTRAVSTTFKFTAFSDTKTGTATLAKLSPQIYAKNPVFGLFPGDVCDAGPNSSCFATWKKAINGNNTNNLFDRMFVSRGNHDSAGASFWSSEFNVAAMVARIGGTNFTGDDFTFSFDYGNTHIIGVDAPGGGSTTISSSTVTWVDNDLKAAEARGITHSFAFWHGPVHPHGGHCCTDDPRFIKVFGAHKSFRAVISGHEHNLGVTTIDSRWGNSGQPFLQVVTGGAGAGLYACTAGRSDWCSSSYGYAMFDVDGNKVTVTMYKIDGTTPAYTKTLTASTSPTPVTTPAPTPVPTPVKTPVPGTTPTPTPKPATGSADVNGDGRVNVFDLSSVLSTWGTAGTTTDINRDGVVNVFDLSALLSRWTG